MVMQAGIIHNSHSTEFRSPFGAVSCHTAISLSLAVSVPVTQVTLRLWRDGQGEELKPMQYEHHHDGYDWYRVTVSMPAEPGLIWYYFIVRQDDKAYYYGNNSAEWGGIGQIALTPPPSFQITVYKQGATTPDWFKNAIIYQVFVDRFANGHEGGKVLNPKKGSLIHAHWDNNPVYVRDEKTGHILAYDFFGGNLVGVIAKLPYLKELGVTCIYFNPLFEAASNHKYDTADYHRIDPMFGSNEMFQELTGQCAELGIRIILDGVFSHTGADSMYFNKEGNYPSTGAYQSPDSPYSSWYRFTDYPDKYECWWGIDALPNVDELDRSYQEFIIYGANSVVRHWARLGAVGWRLDVADELPDEFIEKFRKTMKEIDREAVLIGEVWEDASRKVSYGRLRPYLLGDQLDSVMNYPFRRIVLDFLQNRSTAEQANHALMSLRENYPKHHFYTCMNLIGSHDVPRILTLLGDDRPAIELTTGQLAKKRLTAVQRSKAFAKAKLAALWQFTFPGAPSVYYGDEAGLEGYADPLNRRTYPWGNKDKYLLAWYKQLGALRTRYAVFRTGDWFPLDVHADLVVYLRVVSDGRDLFGTDCDDNVALVVINRSETPVTAEIDISNWVRGLMHDMLNDEAEVAVGTGRFTLELPPLSGKVYLKNLAETERTCGILCHPTSLPSPHGIGDFGDEAYRFVDFLAAAGQKLWQILPLNPPGPGNSPYAALSAFAGNELLISLDKLAADGLLSKADLKKMMFPSAGSINYQAVRSFKEPLFRQAFAEFKQRPRPEQQGWREFLAESADWLEDYALFMAASTYFDGRQWTEWETGLAERDRSALQKYRHLLEDEIDYHCFLQYIFHRQWQELKIYANRLGIRIIGDAPIFVAHNSSDVWAHTDLFDLDSSGEPLTVAGVPPDYFSGTGQLWGNPQYVWNAMAKDGYRWWQSRLTWLLKQVDVIRIDHFRAFAAYWEIPGSAETAQAGRWVEGPGRHFFATIEDSLGPLPIIAEDLGIITDDVNALREELGFPGMKVLHFAFVPENGSCRPIGCDRNTVLYTGTHDNDTTIGWYRHGLLSDPGGMECLRNYLGVDTATDDSELCWHLIEFAYRLKAKTVIIPLQDVLALGTEARMNTPGTVSAANWSWRYEPGSLSASISKKLQKLAITYNR